MKLKDPNLTPVGGFKFEYKIEPSERFPSGMLYFKKNDSSGLQGFTKYVRNQMIVNSVAVPENLQSQIEDFICTYQPSERCFYTGGLGDKIAKSITSFTQVIDSIAGTKLTKKARNCSSCSRRRSKLNK